jgi:hypothetical protein
MRLPETKRIGDRFKSINDECVWEITNVGIGDDWHTSAVVSSGGRHSRGFVDHWWFDDENIWEYIGNFAKAAVFIDLYDKLNE